MSRLVNTIASMAWSSVNRLAREAGDRGWVPPVILEPRVISVGNLQAGGAGKTPLVALLAREAAGRGLRTCILIRGYRGSWEKSGGLIEPGRSPARPSECGDEAALLHELAPDAWIGVGADRVASFSRAEAKARKKFDLVILDDGFQHFAIRKDLDILALTSATPDDTIFRDHPSQAGRAGLIVWTKGHEQPDFRDRPWCRVIYDLPKPDAAARNVWLVTGVADAEQVKATAIRSGYEVLRHIAFVDHASYSRTEASQLLESARAAGARLALTGKDWVKWAEMGISRDELLVLEPELRFVSGRETWDRVVWGV